MKFRVLGAMGSRNLALLAVLVPLLGLFGYAALRSGPLAPVQVTVTRVENRPLTPALFGIGTIEARYTYRVGPTLAGRVSWVQVQVGDRVKAGQLLGAMDPVDLDARITAQEAAVQGAQSRIQIASAQVREVLARQDFALAQVRRYERLLKARNVSEDAVGAKRQEAQVAEAGVALARANLDAARQEVGRIRAERQALIRQRDNLRLIAPADGLVVARAADPGTTVVAGQAVVEVIDPDSLWVNVRFDQLSATGLRAALPARITLRTQPGEAFEGRVLRVEPVADAVTEELLAKVSFTALPDPLPALGELAEVTVALLPRPPAPVVPNACLHRIDGHLGAWLLRDGELSFARVEVAVADLDGQVQLLAGLQAGDQVVVHSQRALSAHSRVRVVERLPGVPE